MVHRDRRPARLDAPVVDRLHPVVEVEVATPLVNRLRVAQPAVFGAVPRQDHGLVGPVRLVPCARRVVG
ncbi:hypothetical protein ACFY30_19755 [Streptomyces sp. NPDC000345]|uniref:hypothetical protein n=1 Tax=Streptomyces sp. NPDC000345 TaxID=3364537 RepID=UPI00368F10D2